MTLTRTHELTSPWRDPEVVDYLVKQWRAGSTATQLVKLLRAKFGIVVTRNACIGRLSRMGEGQSRERAIETLRIQAKHKSQRTERVVVVRKPKPKPPQAPLREPDITTPHARPWQLRTLGQCTWPLTVDGATWSCCSPVERGSFCGAHARVGYDTVRKLDEVRSAKHLTRYDRVEASHA